MAQWKKIITSGSIAEFHHISASGNVVPVIDNGSSLGTSTLKFSDLFLNGTGVINFDSGNVTLTHTNNQLVITGGPTRVDKLEIDSAADYIDVSTDFKIVAAADIILDPAGNNVLPGGDNEDALGASGTAWSDLYLGSGGIINWMSGDVTITHTNSDAGGELAFAGTSGVSFDSHISASGNISSSAAYTGSFGSLYVAGGSTFVGQIDAGHISASDIHARDIHATGNITADGGTITFGDGADDNVVFSADIDSDLIPNIDNSYDLGSAGQAWKDLYLEGDITLTDAGTIQTSAGVLTIDGAGGLTLDSDGTDAVNLGTEAVAKTITIGNAASTKVDINALALDFDSAAATDILAATTLSVKGAGGATFGDDTEHLVYDGSGNVDFDAVALDIDASGAITIDGATTGIIQTAQNLSISSSLNLNLSGSTSTYSTETTLDIDAGSKLSLDGVTGIDIGTTADTPIDIDASTLDIDASGKISIDSADSIDIGTNADKPIDIDSTTLDIDSSGAITIDGTSTGVIETAGNLSISSSAALKLSGSTSTYRTETTLDIDAGSTLDIDAVGKLSIDSAHSIDIGVAQDKPIDIDSTTLDIDASGAITLDGTSTIVISGDDGATFGDDTKTLDFDGSGNVTFTAGTFSLTPATSFDLDSVGAVTIDGSSITIGGDDSGVPIFIGHSTSETIVGDNLGVLGNLGVTGSAVISGSLTVGHAGTSSNISASGEVSAQTLKVSGYGVEVTGTSKIDQDVSTGGQPVFVGAKLGNISIGNYNTQGANVISETGDDFIINPNTTFLKDVTVDGNLVINGTTTTLDAVNLQVSDQLIFLASGSEDHNTDAGIVVQSGSVAGTGSAFYHDISEERWAVAKGVGESASGSIGAVNVISDGTQKAGNIVTVSGSNLSGAAPDVIQYGVGEMQIDLSTGDIWILSEI
jgi:hypothetical protein